MDEGFFENSGSTFGSLFSDAIGAARDVIVSRQEGRAREAEASLRAQFGIPPAAQTQSNAASFAPLSSTPGISSTVIVIGLVAVVAIALFMK